MESGLTSNFEDFDSDSYAQPAIAVYLSNQSKAHETPTHTHRKCQLIMPLEGIVRCQVSDAIWAVPVNSGIWIPSSIPHSNQIAPSTKVCMLFVDPQAIVMPEKTFTLAITPLIKELILHLNKQDPHYALQSDTADLVKVLLQQISAMPEKKLNFPLPKEQRWHSLAEHLMAHPDDRKTIGQWAAIYSMSERTFARAIKKQVGMTFGHWRGQLHLILSLQMLDEGVPVQIIAEKLGYESVSAFITFFKKALGTSPKKYTHNVE